MSESNTPNIGGSNTTIGGIIVTIILGLLYYMNGGEPTTTEEDVAENIEEGPVYEGLENYLPTTHFGEIIEHPHYTISYSEKHKQAEWVAYELTRDMVLKSKAERDHLTFRPDPNLDPELAVKTSDYTRSGYDRGHLVPAQDMAFDEQAMKETFFMTNVSPQEKDFNRGKWKQLEMEVREWAAKYDDIYVITGPILTKRAKKRFPKSKKYIPVPAYYYKIILDYTGKDAKAIAFRFRNEETEYPLSGFVTTIDAIEELTELDFFPELPDDMEAQLESQADLDDWGLTQNAYSVMSPDTMMMVKKYLEEEEEEN